MKRLFTLLLAAQCGTLASGQITIMQSDLPQVGWGFIQGVDTAYNAAVPPGGANQNWNYASLQVNQQDSLLFLSATGTPYASQFPIANLAGNNPQTGFWAYFLSNASGFYINGAYDGGFGIELDPMQMLIPVPFTYQDTYTGYFRFQIDTTFTIPPNTYPARIVQYTFNDIEADGYGSLTLPNGTFNNTLRLKTTTLQIDSIYVDLGLGLQPLPGYVPTQTQQTNFKWLQNGGGTLLLELEADSLGQTADRSNFLLQFVIVGMHGHAEGKAIPAYPNPAVDEVILGFAHGTTYVSVFDHSGSLVKSSRYSAGQTLALPVGKLRAGGYHYLVQPEAGKPRSGKFVVVH